MLVMDMLYWLFVSERLFYIFQLANIFSINLESPYLKCVWHALEKILFVFINLRHITQSVFVVVGAEKEAAGTGHIAKWCPVKQKIPSVNTRGGGRIVQQHAILMMKTNNEYRKHFSPPCASTTLKTSLALLVLTIWDVSQNNGFNLQMGAWCWWNTLKHYFANLCEILYSKRHNAM